MSNKDFLKGFSLSKAEIKYYDSFFYCALLVTSPCSDIVQPTGWRKTLNTFSEQWAEQAGQCGSFKKKTICLTNPCPRSVKAYYDGNVICVLDLLILICEAPHLKVHRRNSKYWQTSHSLKSTVQQLWFRVVMQNCRKSIQHFLRFSEILAKENHPSDRPASQGCWLQIAECGIVSVVPVCF